VSHYWHLIGLSGNARQRRRELRAMQRGGVDARQIGVVGVVKVRMPWIGHERQQAQGEQHD
jgi:hypothetical protein